MYYGMVPNKINYDFFMADSVLKTGGEENKEYIKRFMGIK